MFNCRAVGQLAGFRGRGRGTFAENRVHPKDAPVSSSAGTKRHSKDKEESHDTSFLTRIIYENQH